MLAITTVDLSESAAHRMRIETESRVFALANVPRALVNFDTRGLSSLYFNVKV